MERAELGLIQRKQRGKLMFYPRNVFDEMRNKTQMNLLENFISFYRTALQIKSSQGL
jgi:hypothetical protein